MAVIIIGKILLVHLISFNSKSPSECLIGVNCPWKPAIYVIFIHVKEHIYVYVCTYTYMYTQVSANFIGCYDFVLFQILDQLIFYWS